MEALSASPIRTTIWASATTATSARRLSDTPTSPGRCNFAATATAGTRRASSVSSSSERAAHQLFWQPADRGGRGTGAAAPRGTHPASRSLHNTASTEQLGHAADGPAVLPLQSPRPGLCSQPPRPALAQIDDVIGLTWPLATYCAAADVPYFFHGPYGLRPLLLAPAADEPVFYWQGPSPGSRVLVRSASLRRLRRGQSGRTERGTRAEHHRKVRREVPTRHCSSRRGPISSGHHGHGPSHPRLERPLTYPRPGLRHDEHVFSLHRPAGQTGSDQVLCGRRQQPVGRSGRQRCLGGGASPVPGGSIPTAQKFTSIAQVVAGGGNSSTDLYQAYHRLLTWHEHTNAIDFIAPDIERMRRYETELEENRDMIRESHEFAARAQAFAFQRIAAAITPPVGAVVDRLQPADPTADRYRADRVGQAHARRPDCRSRQPPRGPLANHARRSCCSLPGTFLSLGYKTFAVRRARLRAKRLRPQPARCENRFFRVAFDPATGTITNIWDKQRNLEVVDQGAPHRFNEYLYERFETSDWNKPTTWHRVMPAKLKASSWPCSPDYAGDGTARGRPDSDPDHNPLRRSATD